MASAFSRPVISDNFLNYLFLNINIITRSVSCGKKIMDRGLSVQLKINLRLTVNLTSEVRLKNEARRGHRMFRALPPGDKHGHGDLGVVRR